MSHDLGPLPEPYLSATATALALGENVRQPLYTAAQLQAERERCFALGVAAERAWFVKALGEWDGTGDVEEVLRLRLARELEGG